MSLVFYYSPMSTAVVTHWILEELGIPYETVKVDFQKDTKKPEYVKLNPNGAVPLIVHDGTPIFESAAIAIYLGETFGVEKGLFPAPGPKRGEALKWITAADGEDHARSRSRRRNRQRQPRIAVALEGFGSPQPAFRVLG